MNTLILNDVHLGFTRPGGTTPESRQDLAKYLVDSLASVVLDKPGSTHLVVMGDLFDDFSVDTKYVLEAFNIFHQFLADSSNHLTLVAGNHDHNPRGDKVSSFQLLCGVLKNFVNFTPVPVGSFSHNGYDYYVAHYPNQDLFDHALSELLNLVREGENVFLHANYNNNFAVESDHSLNVSAEVAAKFRDKGATLYFAHEHQARNVDGVVVMGNQWPTSVSDCLGNTEKFYHFRPYGEDEFIKVKTWSSSDLGYGFSKVDWRNLADLDTGFIPSGFIRVEGTATMTEAGEVVNAVASFRRRASDVWVVTSNVAVEGAPKAAENLPELMASVKGFDVWSFMKGHFSAEEYAVLETMK